MSLPDCRPAQCTLTSRSWRKLDVADVNRRLQNVDWSSVYNSVDQGEQWDYFLTVTLPIIDSSAPVRRMKVHNPTAPPLTEATKDLMTWRRAALRASDRDLYKNLNRQVRSAVRRDTREEVDRRIREGGPSSMWRSVKPVISGKQPTRSPPDADADTEPVLHQYWYSYRPTGGLFGPGAGGAPAARGHRSLPGVAGYTGATAARHSPDAEQYIVWCRRFMRTFY